RGWPYSNLLNLADAPLNFERLRLLCGVRVLRAGVDAQLADDAPAQAVVRQHTPDGLLDHLLRPRRHHLAGRAGLQTARITAVAVVQLLLELVAGEADVLRIDHDHVVAEI